jgi:hypothetical protein
MGKLGADGGIGDHIAKPKWMRWPTCDRKLEEVFAAEEVVDAHLCAFVSKLNRRVGRWFRTPFLDVWHLRAHHWPRSGNFATSNAPARDR